MLASHNEVCLCVILINSALYWYDNRPISPKGLSGQE